MKRRSGSVSSVFWGLLVCVLVVFGPACSPKIPDIAPAGEQASRGLVKVPNVYSYKKQQAIQSLRNAGLAPVVENRLSFNFNLIGMYCRVLAQMPLPGDLLEPGSKVTITIYEPTGSCD